MWHERPGEGRERTQVVRVVGDIKVRAGLPPVLLDRGCVVRDGGFKLIARPGPSKDLLPVDSDLRHPPAPHEADAEVARPLLAAPLQCALARQRKRQV